MQGYPTQQQAYPFPGYGHYQAQQQAVYGAPGMSHSSSAGSPPPWAMPEMMQQQQTSPTAWAGGFSGAPVPAGAQPGTYVTPYMAPSPDGGLPGLPQSHPSKMPRPKHIRRSGTLPNGNPGLKSALRKPGPEVGGSHHGHGHGHGHAHGHAHSHSMSMPLSAPATSTGPFPTLMRVRSNSHSGHPQTPRHRSNSLSAPGTPRSRANSGATPTDAPDHIFVSFHSANHLRVDSLHPDRGVAEALMEMVLPMWPYGSTPDTSRPSQFNARFAGSPWSGSNGDATLAYRMICRLFTVLSITGYRYLTSVDVSHSLKPPRLVFVGSQPDPNAHFFVLSFSRSGHRMTLVDPPPAVGDTIGIRLRQAFRPHVTSEGMVQEGILAVELRRGVFGEPEVDKTLFMGYVLKYIKQLGYKLDASVPMARTGVLGFGGRKEIWIFKGPPQRRMSIE